MLLSVIIPMYNEKEIVADCVNALSAEMEKAAAEDGFTYEILFSDDGSTDGCGKMAEDCAGEKKLGFGEIRVVGVPKNAGKGSAVRLGVKESKGDYVLYTDCDLAYGTAMIPEMFAAALREDVDVLIGSRVLGEDGYAGYTFLRKLASQAFLKMLALVAGFSHSDSQCGIKLLRGDAARTVFAGCETDGWAFDFEMLLIAERLGYQIGEHPVRVVNHRASKIRLLRDSVRMFGDVFRIRRSVARRYAR